MFLSVITINYNDAVGLRKTIESVITQSARNQIEFIVIDGGSTDGSKAVLEEYSDRIDYWVSEADRGIYNAMNKGVEVAHGEYCNFMNSGDVFHNTSVVESIIKTRFTADILCGNTTTVEEKPWHILSPEEVTMDTLYNGALNHQSALIRSSLMKKYRYDESLRIVADRKFFVQALIFDNCSYQRIDLDVADYDVNGLSSNNRFKSKEEYNKVLCELLPPRIRYDYARKKDGALCGDSDYEKLFLELKNRNYKHVVYTMSVLYVRFVSLFKKSASFIRSFPLKIR